MTDDRTTPMRQPQWSQQGGQSDEQETVYADQEQVTPPTIPLGDQGVPRVGQQPGQGFVRSTPAGSDGALATLQACPSTRMAARTTVSGTASTADGRTRVSGESGTPRSVTASVKLRDPLVACALVASKRR